MCREVHRDIERLATGLLVPAEKSTPYYVHTSFASKGKAWLEMATGDGSF